MRSPLCDLVGIEVPIIQAGMSIFTSPELAAAVSDAGALGSLGAWNRPADQLRRELAELRDLTDRPFAVNHVVPALDADAFAATLEHAPAVVSFALDDAGDLMRRVHDAGSLVMQQVTTVQQAQLAAEHGADIIVAQGGEAGGYGGVVSTLSLVPQVVDAVRPLPVVAAGGIADGRGIAAVLVLGAAGVNLGSRFLASAESPVGERWKKALVTLPPRTGSRPTSSTRSAPTRARSATARGCGSCAPSSSSDGRSGSTRSRPTRRRCWRSSPRPTPPATESDSSSSAGRAPASSDRSSRPGAIVRHARGRGARGARRRRKRRGGVVLVMLGRSLH